MNWKIAPELTARGYDATSFRTGGPAGRRVKDPVSLYILTRRSVPCVLVTLDNRTPTRRRLDLLKLPVIDSKADRKGCRARSTHVTWFTAGRIEFAEQAQEERYKYNLGGRSLIKL